MKNTKLIDNGDGTTSVFITLDAPIDVVSQATLGVANEMGYASAPESVSPIDFIVNQTKLWWGGFAKTASLKAIEAAADDAAEAARNAGMEELAKNPLFRA